MKKRANGEGSQSIRATANPETNRTSRTENKHPMGTTTQHPLRLPWASPARADTFTLRDAGFFYSILLEAGGTLVTQSRV